MKNKPKKYINAGIASAMAIGSVVAVAPLTTEASVKFPDIKETDHYYNAVISLAERGIIKGYEDGTFKPGHSVTRGQAAKIIAGVLKLDTTNVVNPGFKDVPTTKQLTINCKGKDIEIDAIRLVNEDLDSIISDLPIKTNLKAMIGDIVFSDLTIEKKRIEIRKLQRVGT